jgi:hypothetical protein
MKWIYVLLIVAANQAMAFAQVADQAGAENSDASLTKMARPAPPLITPAIDPKISDSLIWLTMAVIQVGDDYSYNPNAAQVRLEIKQLADEIKRDCLPLKSDLTRAHSNQDPVASPDDLWRARETEIAEKKNKIRDLISKKEHRTLLSMPSIGTEVGSGALCNVGQQAKLPYMEQTGSDIFKLHYTETQHLGFDMSLTAQEIVPASSGETESSVILSPVKFTVTAIDGRQEIKGVDLPIGKPIITRRTIETSIQLTETEPGIVELPVAKGRHVFMLVFVRLPVQPVP